MQNSVVVAAENSMRAGHCWKGKAPHGKVVHSRILTTQLMNEAWTARVKLGET